MHNMWVRPTSSTILPRLKDSTSIFFALICEDLSSLLISQILKKSLSTRSFSVFPLLSSPASRTNSGKSRKKFSVKSFS